VEERDVLYYELVQTNLASIFKLNPCFYTS